MQQFQPGGSLGPQAVPSPIDLVIHFAKLGRGSDDPLGLGEKLYSLSLAPEDAPNHMIYEYMPDKSKDSSSGSHRAILSALGQPIFNIHVSGEYSLSGSGSGEIVGFPSGPHCGFRENGTYKPLKKQEGVDRHNPLCRVLPGQNTDVQVAKFCARVMSSLLNPSSLTGSKAIKPNKLISASYSASQPSNQGDAATQHLTEEEEKKKQKKKKEGEEAEMIGEILQAVSGLAGS